MYVDIAYCLIFELKNWKLHPYNQKKKIVYMSLAVRACVSYEFAYHLLIIILVLFRW